MLNMKRFYFFLLALSLWLPYVSDAKSKAPARVTVMSYNIRLGVANEKDYLNGWVYRQGATPIMIAMEKPDVFGVQEAFRFQMDYILTNCPDYAAYGIGRDDGVDKGERRSIFWNTKTVEMEDWGTLWLSETPDEPSYGWDAACRRTATWGFFKMKKCARFVERNAGDTGHIHHARGTEIGAIGSSCCDSSLS